MCSKSSGVIKKKKGEAASGKPRRKEKEEGTRTLVGEKKGRKKKHSYHGERKTDVPQPASLEGKRSAFAISTKKKKGKRVVSFETPTGGRRRFHSVCGKEEGGATAPRVLLREERTSLAGRGRSSSTVSGLRWEKKNGSFQPFGKKKECQCP